MFKRHWSAEDIVGGRVVKTAWAGGYYYTSVKEPSPGGLGLKTVWKAYGDTEAEAQVNHQAGVDAANV